jgi:hypothetical protein
MFLPSTKPVWFGLITRGRNSWILLPKVLAMILYMLPKSVIGRLFRGSECSPDLGIRVIMPSLMCSEVNPRANMALKASSSVGATSFTYSWKNYVGIPSCPGALPLGTTKCRCWWMNEKNLTLMKWSDLILARLWIVRHEFTIFEFGA